MKLIGFHPKARQSMALFISLISLLVIYMTFEQFNVNLFSKLLRSDINGTVWNFENFSAPNGKDVGEMFGINGTTCGKSAWRLGNHQKVIAYSVYGSKATYYRGLNETLETIKKLYPGWQVRIYTDKEAYPKLQPLLKTQHHLHLCNPYKLPDPLKSIASYPPSMWRFAPMGDLQVDALLVRDADSQILPREVAAVNEWLDTTNKSLHVMRDHWKHGAYILAGTFGLRITPENRDKIRLLRDEMYEKTFGKTERNFDQILLSMVVWPELHNDVLAHDSYLCQMYPGTSPFPTKRDGNKYVGSPFYMYNSDGIMTNECPVECRPKNHSDWTYC